MTEPLDDSDIVRFDATSLEGHYRGYVLHVLPKDGSDVGLTTTAADVVAAELPPTGKIAISTSDTVSVSGVPARDEDLLPFTPVASVPTRPGHSRSSSTAATWASGTAARTSMALRFTVPDSSTCRRAAAFAVPGVSGADEDVFVFDPDATWAHDGRQLLIDALLRRVELASRRQPYALDFPAP